MFEALCGDPEEWEVWGSGACPWQCSDLHPSVAHQEILHWEPPHALLDRYLGFTHSGRVGEVQRGYRAQGSTLGQCTRTGNYGNRGLGRTTGDNFCAGVRAVVPLETACLGGGSSLGGWVNPGGV